MISTLVFKVVEWRKKISSRLHRHKSSSSQCDSKVDCPSIYHSAADGTQRFLESMAELPEPAIEQVFAHPVQLDEEDLCMDYNVHAAEIARLVDIELNLASAPTSKYNKEETKTIILDELEARNLTDSHFKADKQLLSCIIDQLLYPNKVDSLLPHFYNLNGTEKIVEDLVLAEIPMLGGDEFAEHSAKIARSFCRSLIKWRKSNTLRKLADLWCDAEQKEMEDQRQVLNKFEEVCDAIYTCLVANLKGLMNEAGFRHQQFVNSLAVEQVEHSTEWLAKFINFMLCVQPLNQSISTQQFWTEGELGASLRQFEQWLGQEMLHRNELKEPRTQLEDKEQQRLTSERLKHLSIGQTARCMADMRRAIKTTFTLLNIRQPDSKKKEKKAVIKNVQAQVEELVLEAEDVCFYLEQFPPTNIREFQEAVIMLLWTELGVNPEAIFGLRLEDLKFYKQSDGCLSMQVECLENAAKHAVEVTQKRSKYSTFDWLLMYLRMRRVLDPDNLGTDKICIKVEYSQQPLFLAEEKQWLVGMTPFNPNSNFLRKVARQMGFTEGSLTWSSFKKGMAKKIFRSLLHTHNPGDLTWKEVEETLILKGFWKNTSGGESLSSQGHTLYKRQFQQWKRGGGNWSVEKCVPYLHEYALPSIQFVLPTQKIVEVIGENMEKHWVEESKNHLIALVDYLKGLDTKSLATNRVELEAAREVLIKEKDAQQAWVLYKKCKCAQLLNDAKSALHNHFGLGKKLSECKDLKLSLEGMQKVNPCFLYDLLPVRSLFRDLDMHYWRGNEALQCFAASCSASFTDMYSLQVHLKQHLEKDLPMRVVCECANFSTTVHQASLLDGGGNSLEELSDHIRCAHHTNAYCTMCRALRAMPKTHTDILADDTKQCFENGHLIKWPQSVLVVFEKVDNRCRECVSVACSKRCLADVDWRSLITDHMKANRGSLTADAFTTRMMRLLDSSRNWDDMDEVPGCAKKCLRQLFLTFVNEF